MKRTIIIILLAFFTLNVAWSQNKADQIRKLLNENKLEEAAELIPAAAKENFRDAKFLALCGDIYFELEKYEDALDMYRRSDERESGNAEVIRKIGRTMSYLGRHNEAIQFLNRALRRNDKDYYMVLELANAYLRADSLNQAELLITRARGMDRSKPDAYVALGDLYFAQKVYELARQNYEEALSLDNKLLDARTKLAISYYWLANKELDDDLANELFARSLREWNTITQQDPNNARAWFEQGKILFFSNRHEPAVQSFYKYINLRPSGYLGRWYLSQSLYLLGLCDSAAPQLEIVAENIDSVRSKARVMLAECYFSNKNYKKANDLYTEIKASEKLDAINMKRLAVAKLNIGDTTGFIKTYIEGIDLYPEDNCKDMVSLGKNLVKLMDYASAIYVFTKKLETEVCRDETDLEVKYWLGVSYFLNEKDTLNKNGRLQQAKKLLEEAVAGNPKNYNAIVYLADVNAALGDLKTAEQLFLKVMEEARPDTSMPEVKTALNQAFAKYCGLKLEARKFPDLLKAATDWSKLFPDSPIPFLYIAISYQGQNDRENACRFYRRVLQIDPKNTTAKKYISDLGCS